MKYFVYTIIVIVTAAVVAGFFIVGSPQKERLRRFDDRRLSDLQFLQSEIINYWINKNMLPATLIDIRDDIRGISAPKDPETGSDYTYKILKPEAFSLCATFNLPSFSKSESGVPKPAYPADSYKVLYDPYYGQQNWEHDAGLVCFDRVIDPQLYRPIKEKI